MSNIASHYRKGTTAFISDLKEWICKKVTDKNHYLFNLIGDTDAKPNLRKPNAIMESRLTVFNHVRASTTYEPPDLKYLSIIA